MLQFLLGFFSFILGTTGDDPEGPDNPPPPGGGG